MDAGAQAITHLQEASREIALVFNATRDDGGDPNVGYPQGGVAAALDRIAQRARNAAEAWHDG